MDPATGAERPAPSEVPGLPSAARDFTSAVTRFVRAFAGLFGLELRETGGQALVLASLAVAFIAACVFTYLFLLTALVILVVGWLGGGWMIALLGLAFLHALLAAGLWLVLANRARRPLFPGTREALRREVERIS